MLNVLKIVNTHGVRGEVKALHYTDGEAFFKKVKNVYTKSGEKLIIKGWRFQKGAVLLRFDGVDTMEKAEAMKFTELYAKEEDLPKLPDGQHYFFELIGLTGVLEDGTPFGKVTDVIESPASSLLEFTKENGKKVLVPNIPVFVKSVKDGKIEINAIEGLIDDEI